MAYHKWTEDEIEYIRSIYPYYPNKVIVEMVKSKLGIDVSPRNLRNLRHKYNFPHKAIPNAGSFKKGAVPWNKGRKMLEEEKKKIMEAWFKKGDNPYNTLKVGSTRTTKDGYKEIKIAEPNKWKLYQRYVFEKEHDVELTSSDIIIFADGDRSNFDIDNLVKVSRSTLLILNRKRLIYSDKELTKVGVSIGKVLDAAYKRERENKR